MAREMVVSHYGVDLWRTVQSQKPEVRAVLEVKSLRHPRVEELIKDVMLSWGVPFAARAVVERLEGSRVVASATRCNVSCDL